MCRPATLGSTYRFGRFELDPGRRQLLANGGQVTLGARAFEVLVALVEHRDRLVTKDELLEIAWPGLVVEENNLQVQVSALRKILGPQIIVTLPGRGYRFAAKLESAAEPSVAPSAEPPVAQPGTMEDSPPVTSGEGPAQSTTSVSEGPAATVPEYEPPRSPDKPVPPVPEPSHHEPRPRRWELATVAVLLLVVVVAGWVWMRQPAEVSPPVGTHPDGKSVAVLPFANLSDEKENAYFADGIHEDLLTQLSLLGDLKVVSRTSVMEYRNSTKKVGQIGSELGVGTLIEGSVRRAGNRIRVSAQVIDARSDRHLWARSFDRELKDVFAIQAELATEIARALKASLSPQEEKRLAKRPTPNLEAYDLLLRAKDLDTQAYGTMGGQEEQMVKLLTRAVEVDPKFALAWARLGSAHAQMYMFGTDSSEARKAMATQSIDRAIQLAPEDIEVQIEVGNVRSWAQGDFNEALTAFQKVLQLSPNNIDALLGLYDLLENNGRHGEARPLVERVLSVDPRNEKALVYMAAALSVYRQFDRGIAMWKRVLSIRPEDIAKQLAYHAWEDARTGSWESFDRWRAMLPAGIHEKSPEVWLMDVRRAAHRRDFAEVERLCESAPEWYRKNEWWSRAIRQMQVLSALASGDRARAVRLAGAALKDVESGLALKPRLESANLRRAAIYLAILGQREAAFDRLRLAMSKSRFFGEKVSIDHTITVIHALLGERAAALAGMRREVGLPYSYVRDYRTSLPFSSLWDDPEFLAIVNDPANNAPLPLDLKYEFVLDKLVR